MDGVKENGVLVSLRIGYEPHFAGWQGPPPLDSIPGQYNSD